MQSSMRHKQQRGCGQFSSLRQYGMETRAAGAAITSVCTGLLPNDAGGSTEKSITKDVL